MRRCSRAPANTSTSSIAQVFEARFPAVVETQPELVAQHYTAAGCAEQAVHYWQRAGEHASNRSAHLEAVSHLTTGIELLKTLPETLEHTQLALSLYIALGAALIITKGQAAPEVEHAYTSVTRAVSAGGRRRQSWSQSCLGCGGFMSHGHSCTLRVSLGKRCCVWHNMPTILRWLSSPTMPLGRRGSGLARCRRPASTWRQCIALYTPDQRRAPVFRIGHDPGVACRTFTAATLWLLGYPAQALARVHEALALAHELSHPYSLAWAQCWAAWVSQFRRDVPAVHEHAEAAVALSTEQGFPLWAAWGTSLRGWALAMQGQGEAGLAQVRQGIAAWRATGAALLVPYLCTVLADVCCPPGPPGRRPPGAGRGPHPGGAT